MKELSIEEKAKAYDKAIKRAKELLEIGLKDTRDKRVVLSFFPELRESESEDEMIRKELVQFFKEKDEEDFEEWVPKAKVLAWLEKQGESIKIKKGKNYLCTKTHKYAGVEWIEGVKYYSPEDYSLVNQGCTCYCPKYSKEEHNNFFKEVEYDGCLENQAEQLKKK